MKKLIIIIVLLIAACGLGAYLLSRSVVHKPAGEIYHLRAGASKRLVIKQLHEQGIMPHPYLFSVVVYLQPTKQIKAGEYLFPQAASVFDIWQQVTSGTGLYYRPFTIIPGWTFAQLRAVLAKTPELKQTVAALSDQAIMQKLGYATVSPEGEFLPETYYYTKGDTDFSVLKRAFTMMQNKFARAWIKRAKDLPYTTAYQALIVSSLVEKEAFLSSERPVIAGVIVNRLKKDMLLQIDPTVIFGLGDAFDGDLKRSDLKKDTPYNTYLHKGLPPTPIGMPSLGAIDAVLHPQQHHYLYFVARGDGSHQFSTSLSEHNDAVSAAAKVKKDKRFFNESMLRGYLGYEILQQQIKQQAQV